MYLITRWFGTFLFEKGKIKEKILFLNDEKKIAKNIQKINNFGILDEEKRIVKNFNRNNIIVNEKRLGKIGKYCEDDDFFKNTNLNPFDFGFSKDSIQKIMYTISSDQIKDDLKSIDLQIIQMINTLDDFIQTKNLLNERYEHWNSIQYSNARIDPLKKFILSIDTKLSKIESLIEKDMNNIAPNLTKIIGPLTGARLISSAGSLKKLSLLPASTIQVLGAEKALFRYKKEGGKPPKHGIIFQNNLIKNSNRKDRGKIARLLSNKIILAARADTFTKNDISRDIKKDLKNRLNEIRNH